MNTELDQVLDLILQAIKETATSGISGGMLYSALMVFGCTLSQYEAIMGALVKTGKVVSRGHFYFTPEHVTVRLPGRESKDFRLLG